MGKDIAEIIETKIIYKEPGRFAGQETEYFKNEHGHPKVGTEVIEEDRYLGWPTIAKTNEGELLVAYSGDRDSHICPWGQTHLIRSKDNGKTWSKHETINNTPLDDRDAGIIQTKSGALLISWFTSLAFAGPAESPQAANYAATVRYARHIEKIPEYEKEKWFGNWTIRSEDNGKTWQKPSRTLGTAPHGPIQLKDGRLLYIGNNNDNGKYRITIEESCDDGKTWQLLSEMPENVSAETGFYEPHLVELKSGKIIAMFRCHRGNPLMKQSESFDGGKTWSEVHVTPIKGFPPHLLQVDNGLLIVAYCHRWPPFGERVCVSRDEGETWDYENEITLASAVSQDIGYPSSVELDDGSIYTVYYQAQELYKPPCLMATHWKLK